METSIDHSEQLGDLAKALAKAQSELQDAKKDSVNPHFKNRYASLGSVRSAVTAILAKNGLAPLQTFEPHGESGVCVVTWLLHESGQWLRSRLYLPVSKKDAQGFGSAISYGRRYSLAAITGISADDDDDGAAAVGNGKSTAAAQPAAVTVQPGLEADFAKRLDTVTNGTEHAKLQAEVGRAVQSGALDKAARDRLREKNAATIKRLVEANSGAAAE